jgi:hypothetical protein
MRSVSKRLAIPAILVIGILGAPSVALADGTCGTAIGIAVTSGKLAKVDLNGDGIVCAQPAKVLGKGGKITYFDNS